MIATVDSVRITKGLVRVPRRGAMWAELELETETELGGAVTIQIGDVSLVGDVVRGGTSVSVSTWQIRGALAWDAAVAPKSYAVKPSASGGVKLSTVLTDLARDVGAPGSIELPSPDRVVGRHFCRAGSAGAVDIRARDVLSQLIPAWHVDADNVIQCRDRDSGDVETTDVRVLKRHPAQPLRTVATETPSAFAPGLSFEGTRIDALAFVIAKSSITLNLWGPS